jgi:hypothetical protein
MFRTIGARCTRVDLWKKLRGRLYRICVVSFVAGIRIALVRHALPAWHIACSLGNRRRPRTTHGSDREDVMNKEPRGKPAPRIGRKDLQDPDRDVRNPREGRVEREPGRSDRGAGAGRLDEEGCSRRPETDSPRASDDVPPAK